MKNKLIIKTVCLFLSLFLISAAASTSPAFCRYYPFLKGGIDVQKFKRCQALNAARCKRFDNKCQNKVLAHNFCRQTRLLLKVVPWAMLEMTTVRSHGRLNIVASKSVADGVITYSLVGSGGCLIYTNIDPRKLSKQLSKKYGQRAFVMVSDKPVYTVYPNKKALVAINLEVRSPCLACAVIGRAKLGFDFSDQGRFLGVRLIRFSKPDSSST